MNAIKQNSGQKKSNGLKIRKIDEKPQLVVLINYEKPLSEQVWN